MSEFVKTGAVLGVAAALTVLAFSMKPGEVRLDLFDDQGEIFFPEFTSGDDIAELELTAFRPSSSSIYAFSVKRDDKGVWTIPSHGNYAADADDQMGKAASMMIGLTKQAVVGDVIQHRRVGTVRVGLLGALALLHANHTNDGRTHGHIGDHGGTRANLCAGADVDAADEA